MNVYNFIADTFSVMKSDAEKAGIDLDILRETIQQQGINKDEFKWTEEEITNILDRSLFKTEVKHLTNRI